jgi:hypothetical protein
MPIDRPNALELLEAVRQHLVENLAPTLAGQPAFHLRVATNALAIVERTMIEGAAMDRAELIRLQNLLGGDGDLLDLNQRLSEKIRTEDLGAQKEAVLAHLRETVTDKLRLANPRYLAPRK